MVQYAFREDGPVIVKNRAKADPQKIGEALDKARKATPVGGDMRETVIEVARNKRDYLNRFFEWDDAKAGHEYRLIQVNQLICSIRTHDEETGEHRPAFVSLTPDRGHRGFHTADEIVSNADLQAATLRAADRDLAAFQRRHRALSDLCQDAAAMREKIADRLAQTESRAAA